MLTKVLSVDPPPLSLGGWSSSSNLEPSTFSREAFQCIDRAISDTPPSVREALANLTSVGKCREKLLVGRSPYPQVCLSRKRHQGTIAILPPTSSYVRYG